jgi:GPH family glycoside/pentoside/hexuronide:cation symporter
MMFSNNSIPVIMIGMVLTAIGSAPFIGTMYALVAEIAEYAFMKFKVRMDGTIYSCSSVGIKLGSGIGIAVVGWLLSAQGYDGALTTQPGSAIAMIQALNLAAPLVFAILMTLLLGLLNVEKVNAALRTEIKE